MNDRCRGAGRIRVLVLVDELVDGAGGAERFATGLATALTPDRFEVMVCATRAASGEMPRELDEAGIEWFCLERGATFDLRPWLPLLRFIRRRRPQILHAHKFGSNLWGTLIGRLCRVPVVIAHEHTWSYEGQPVRRLLDGWVIGRLATRFVAVSELDRTRMVEVEGVPERRTVYIPTAFIPRPPAEAAPDPRAKLGIPPDAPLVGTVAALREQKRLDLLLDAFAALGPDFPDARLLLVGDGPARPGLEQRAAPLGDRVIFTGTRTDVEAVVRTLDVAAMTSDFEGMPLFAFEAMAYGTPLVSTSVGALPDIVVDGETGVLVPRRDTAALEGALRGLLADSQRREDIARAAHESLDGYSLEAAAERFADLYERLVAEAVR